MLHCRTFPSPLHRGCSSCDVSSKVRNSSSMDTRVKILDCLSGFEDHKLNPYTIIDAFKVCLRIDMMTKIKQI